MIKKFLFLTTILILFFIKANNIWALSGTRGVPLGGMGTGYVKYNPVSGQFATSGKQPPPAADGDEWAGGKYVSSSSGFHFYVKADGNAQVINRAKTNKEDAKIPVHTADFGDLGNVNFKLVAFGPYNIGDTNLAMLPCAFFEIQAKNKNSNTVDIAVAMEFTNCNTAKNNLLGGSNDGTLVQIKGQNRAIGYGAMSSSDNAFLIATTDHDSPIYSVGKNISEFSSNGILDNSNGNIIAIKLSVSPNTTARFQFVLSWYRLFRSGTKVEDYYYNNFFSNSQEIALSVIDRFGQIRDGAQYIVDKTVAVNLPSWFTDRLCNNLYPIIHNSQMAKDGRMAFWEGAYPIIGTLDQAGHMALFPSFSWPSHQWRQMEYWARRAYQGEDAGQIHHDHNSGIEFNKGGRFMHAWELWDVPDYPYCPDTRDWADLNCMLIYGVYELFCATADMQKLAKMWPYLKTTGARLRKQCTWNNAPSDRRHLPYNCMCSYDNKSFMPDMGAFNGSIALCAYNCMKQMAIAMNDESEASIWDSMYTKGRAEFTNIYIKNNINFATGKEISESNVGGYGFARCYGFPAIFDSADAVTALSRLTKYYSSINTGNIRDKLGWSCFYTTDHIGGLASGIYQSNIALMFHHWNWQFGYANPQYVYWQDLFRQNNQFLSYCTAPFVWRSLFQIEGYWLDMFNKRLFIRPSLPDSMVAPSGTGFQKGQLRNAPLITPYGWGTLNYTENENEVKTQQMTISFDGNLPSGFNELILKNNTGLKQPFVHVNKDGAPVALTATAEGTGFEKIIRVKFAQPLVIGKNGIEVIVSKETVPVFVKPCRIRGGATGFGVVMKQETMVLSFVLDSRQHVTIQVSTLDGRIIKKAEYGFMNSGFNQISLRLNNQITATPLIVSLTLEKGTMKKIVTNGL